MWLKGISCCLGIVSYLTAVPHYLLCLEEFIGHLALHEIKPVAMCFAFSEPFKS
jgi:hypothetical protein